MTKGKTGSNCVKLGCERKRCTRNGGVHQNGRNSPTTPVVEAEDRKEIESGSRAEAAAQYQLLKADASGRRVPEED